MSAARRLRGLMRSEVLSGYWTLTKPDGTFIMTVTAGAGFWMGAPAHFPWTSLLHTLAGTVPVASGAATLNPLIEGPFDAHVRRTARRPLVSRRLGPSPGLYFGASLSVTGAIDC